MWVRLSPRQKICSTLAHNSMEANSETKVPFSMEKGQAIGQLRDRHTPFLGIKSMIDLFQKGFEPQATNTQEPFVASIFAIDHLSMPVVKTTATYMCRPPHRQIHDEEPAIQMSSIREAATFNTASSTLLILETGFDSHPSCLLASTFLGGSLIRDQKPCLVISWLPANTERRGKLMLLP